MRSSALAAGASRVRTPAIAITGLIWGQMRPRIIGYLLSAMHRVRQALQRDIEGCILLGKTETHHRRHRILFIKGGHRDRRDLVVGDDALAERLVVLVEAERRKVHGEEIRALRAKHREADALQPPGETVAAARQF